MRSPFGLRAVGLALLATLCEGCVPIPLVEFYNNTDVAVTVVVAKRERSCRVQPGKYCRFDWSTELAILTSGTNYLSYDLPSSAEMINMLTLGFARKRLHRNSFVRLQFENDGTISILPVASRAPVKNVGMQPYGFPLRPRAAGGG